MGSMDHMQATSPGGLGVGVGVPQQGLQYNVGPPFEHLDQLFKTSLEDLTDGSSIMQFNLPFTFATSNLR